MLNHTSGPANRVSRPEFDPCVITGQGVEDGGQCVVLPLQVHRGDVEDHSFEPQDHEEPLGEGAVADALSVTPRLLTAMTRRQDKTSTLMTTH